MSGDVCLTALSGSGLCRGLGIGGGADPGKHLSALATPTPISPFVLEKKASICKIISIPYKSH